MGVGLASIVRRVKGDELTDVHRTSKWPVRHQRSHADRGAHRRGLHHYELPAGKVPAPHRGHRQHDCAEGYRREDPAPVAGAVAATACAPWRASERSAARDELWAPGAKRAQLMAASRSQLDRRARIGNCG